MIMKQGIRFSWKFVTFFIVDVNVIDEIDVALSLMNFMISLIFSMGIETD